MTSLTDLTSVIHHRNPFITTTSTFTHRRVNLTRRHLKQFSSSDVRFTRHSLRCSIAKDTPPVTPVPAADVSHSEGLLDCVVVGGGISGLCIAQALATKHATKEVIVTEARERVGGNI
nr:protoporphyrinogen oxidase 1, chloroplastic [Tanacetum cinerariifolium]